MAECGLERTWLLMTYGWQRRPCERGSLVAQSLDKVIQGGVLFLIVFTPLMFGSVHVRNYCIMGFVAFGLVIVWMLKMILTGRYEFKRTPMDWLLLGFVVFIIFQLAPLPPKLIRTVSPSTYSLYKHTVPNYDGFAQKNTPQDFNLTTAGLSSAPGVSAARTWRPISIYPYATKTMLLKVLGYLAVFYLIINNLSGRKQLSRLVWAIILLGFFEAVYGAVEYFSGHQHIFSFKKVYYIDSLTGTFINRNHLAGYLGMVIPLCLALFCALRYQSSFNHRSPDAQTSEKDKHLELVIGSFALFMLVAAIFTHSRMGIMSVLASLILFSAMMKVNSASKATRAAVRGVAVSAAILAVYLGVTPILERFLSIPSQFGPSGRWGIWATTASMWKDFSLVGAGLGTFEYIFPKYLSRELGVIYTHAHNDYVQGLAEVGLVGVSLLVVGASLFLRKVFILWADRRDKYVKYLALGAAVGVFSLSLHEVADFNGHIPSNALLLFVLLAVCLGIVSSRSRGETGSERSVSVGTAWIKLRRLRPVVIGILCAVFLAETYSVYSADRLYRLAMNGGHHASEREAFLRGAMAKDPWNALYPFELGKLARKEGTQHLRTAVSLNPSNAAYWYTLGMKQLAESPADAGHLFATAAYLEPSSWRYHLAHGWYLLGWQNDPHGLRNIRQALSLNGRDVQKILEITWQLAPSPTGIMSLVPQGDDGRVEKKIQDFVKEKSGGAALAK